MRVQTPPEAPGFTHVDPFEDTESRLHHHAAGAGDRVSPTSIRSRILKVEKSSTSARQAENVSPTSIRSRILKVLWAEWPTAENTCFTHVDPFEDTERIEKQERKVVGVDGFTHVDPFEDTESERTPRPNPTRQSRRFTHVDPFEDTESCLVLRQAGGPAEFHPRRSVRGY